MYEEMHMEDNLFQASDVNEFTVISASASRRILNGVRCMFGASLIRSRELTFDLHGE
jgi:hypothetical protein